MRKRTEITRKRLTRPPSGCTIVVDRCTHGEDTAILKSAKDINGKKIVAGDKVEIVERWATMYHEVGTVHTVTTILRANAHGAVLSTNPECNANDYKSELNAKACRKVN